MLWEIIISLLVLCLVDYLWKRKIDAKFSNVPGPPSLPLIGCIYAFVGVNPDDLLGFADSIRQKYGRITKFWILHLPGVLISDITYVQELLSSTVEIKKNYMYSLFTAWLGDGLLVSKGSKWFARRRVITPAFHFTILEDFVKVFDQQVQIFVNKLTAQAVNEKTVIDVHDSVALATLDVICETAMGVRINAQTDEECEYVRLLKKISSILVKRYAFLPYRIDFFFKLLAPKLAKEHRDTIAALHGFTERIIKERRQEMLAIQMANGSGKVDHSDLGIKKRMALLDVLLSSTIDGKPLTDADIREEVDTFMFEGHDTTKSGIGFTLYCISREPEVQRRVYKEIKEVIGSDIHAELSFRALSDLKYTEKVIKESLRMYPPVPFIGRDIDNDLKLPNNDVLPKGSNVLISIIALQNDPEYFPEPARFLPERDTKEGAFSYVPFSAGPRNCIGQRFAMLEMKAFVARTIQHFELLPLGAAVEPAVSVVLKSNTGWQMGFRKRH